MNNTVSVQNNHVSVCDIMKGNTSEIIRKFESQIPSIIQNYSNLYTTYLHVFDDLFGTCYIHEKEFFDKLNIDQALLKQLKDNSELLKNRYLENIEIAAKFLDEQVKLRISTIQSFESFAHVVMESYAKTLSQFNQSMTFSK
ncbi:MAG: hypothetical protein HZB73_05095 [Nitrosarchaeum sp.]|nr:hypothetical protein [Nitrosarchaeum sp.]